jgi:hypothetical protein
VLGLNDIELSVDLVYVKFNSTSVEGGRPLDWSAVSQTQVSLTSNDKFIVGGTLTLNAFGFVQATAGFEFVSKTIDVDVNGDGQYNVSDGDLDDAGLITLLLQVTDFFVGDPAARVGFELKSGSLAVAVITPQDPDDDRTYLAIGSSLGGASLLGIPDLIVTANGLSLEINQALSDSDPDLAALDWSTQVGNFDDDKTSFTPETIALGPSSALKIDFSGELLQVSGDMFLKIYDYVFAKGKFAFYRGADRTAILNDGTDTTPASEIEVSYLTVGADAVDIFVGSGPYFQDSDGDGIIDDEPAA